jgi:hypothetical protein
VAIFSFFKRSSEMPEYRVETNPKLANKQGAYALLSSSGQVLKRGQKLEFALKPIEQKHLKMRAAI